MPTPKTAWTLGKLNVNAPYVYFTMGGSKYLNNHLGGADNFRVAQHNPIGANNKAHFGRSTNTMRLLAAYSE